MGQPLIKPVAEPTRLGIEFLGWENIPAIMPAQDTVVIAKWKVLPGQTISCILERDTYCW